MAATITSSSSTSSSSDVDSRPELIVVVGPTAVGKSKLGIQLAKALNGEIISADSIQVYEGLDILSNKVTTSEADGIVHHLISCAKPTDHFDVHAFRTRAIPLIDDIRRRGRTPIIVGGTFYWVEAVLWKSFMSSQDAASNDTSVPISTALTSLTPAAAWAKLNEVDPIMAAKWHMNNTRRVLRSLQVYEQTGKQHSQLLEETGGLRGHDGLQYRCVILWLDADRDVLDTRLNTRVDTMVNTGMLAELEDMYHRLCKLIPSGEFLPTKRTSPADAHELHDANKPSAAARDFEWGILQSLGFKEFLPYLQLKFKGIRPPVEQKGGQKKKTINNNTAATTATTTTSDSKDIDGTDNKRMIPVSEAELSSLWNKCVEQLKIGTRQYARRQMKWIRLRLTGPRGDGVPIYRLDSSVIHDWDTRIYSAALGIAKGLLEHKLVDPTPFAPPPEAHSNDKQRGNSTKHTNNKRKRVDGITNTNTNNDTLPLSSSNSSIDVATIGGVISKKKQKRAARAAAAAAIAATNTSGVASPPSSTANGSNNSSNTDNSDTGSTTTASSSSTSSTVTAVTAGSNTAGSEKQWRKYTCDICHRTYNGDHEWNQHQISRRHRSAVSQLVRLQQRTLNTKTPAVSTASTVVGTDAVTAVAATTLSAPVTDLTSSSQIAAPVAAQSLTSLV